ncbi:MAG: 1-acyl-sn-glycerol-3-phosphate acyltransferase [Lachnospiraceae bacterium]|nr:1-acyl-sn-glycerol-3-phosphate acyltransferase [Lachnospiraceae bacterium]
MSKIKDLRFSVPIAVMLPWIFCYSKVRTRYMMNHPDKYSIQDRYDFGMKVIDHIAKHARVTTLVTGRENVPTGETVVFYSNHQGKYDALGILRNMDNIPCAPLWEMKAADRLLAHEMAYLVNAVLIDLESLKGKAKGIVDAIEQIKAGGNMLIFPEGKTDPDKGNALGEFQAGCFACSLKTHTTIVPVAIYDSYKAMNGNNIFDRVRVQIHFLDPIRYDEYKDMNKQEIADLIKGRIAEKLEEIEFGPERISEE